MTPLPEIALLLPRSRGAATASLARRAEAAGFDRLVARAGRGCDPFATLAFAAAVTTHVRLAAAGVALPGRPCADVAAAARTLDDLSGGRFALWAADRPDGPPRTLTTGAGRALDAQLDELAAGPAAAVPLLLSGCDRRALERAGHRADGVVLGPTPCPYDVTAARVELTAAWRRHDRGGRPQVAAFLAVDGLLELHTRVAALADAGATTVVLAARPADVVEELAAALDLPAGLQR